MTRTNGVARSRPHPGGAENGKDLWEAPYEPYSQRRISQEVVRLVIDKSRVAAGKSMSDIARHLKAVTGDRRKTKKSASGSSGLRTSCIRLKI